jgi:multidrug efflux pump subunit AcrB
MAGAVLLLYVTGSSINLMSMIGLIVMCGIIINDSILKIDAINQLVNSGVALDSAIHTAGKKRLHSIVMITLTTTGTLLPTLFMRDPGSLLQQPLVIALIGGMIPGMFVSLLVIPMLYRFFYLRKNRHHITLKKINIPDEVASL